MNVGWHKMLCPGGILSEELVIGIPQVTLAKGGIEDREVADEDGSGGTALQQPCNSILADGQGLYRLPQDLDLL